jgi:Arc/MetJ-type ribon-helix-helix transcriptional regulator
MNTQQLLNIFNRSSRRSTSDKKQVITARIPERLAIQITELTESSKLKRSDVIRLLLEYALSNYNEATQSEWAIEFSTAVQQVLDMYKRAEEPPEVLRAKLQEMNALLLDHYPAKKTDHAE